MLYWRFKPPAPSQGIWEKTQRLLYLDMDVTSERISNEHWTCVCIWEVFLEWAFTCIFWVRFILSGACPFSVLPSPFSCAFAGSPRFQGPFGCHVFRHLMSKCLLCCLTQHCLLSYEYGRHVGNGQRWPLSTWLLLVGALWKCWVLWRLFRCILLKVKHRPLSCLLPISVFAISSLLPQHDPLIIIASSLTFQASSRIYSKCVASITLTFRFNHRLHVYKECRCILIASLLPMVYWRETWQFWSGFYLCRQVSMDWSLWWRRCSGDLYGMQCGSDQLKLFVCLIRAAICRILADNLYAAVVSSLPSKCPRIHNAVIDA